MEERADEDGGEKVEDEAHEAGEGGEARGWGACGGEGFDVGVDEVGVEVEVAGGEDERG